MTQLLRHLAYRPVAVVKKRRRMYPLQRGAFQLTICLDDVEELGHFAEVEIVAPDEQSDAARQVLQEVTGQLGLSDVERRSYLGLILEKKP
jgi:adenylate cyclase class 2